MDFNDTAIWKLAHTFGATEIILFLSSDEMKQIESELKESRGGKSIPAEMHTDEAYTNRLGMQMYQFNGTKIHVGDKEKLMEIFAQHINSKS